MCVIIDACAFNDVFREPNSDFFPVYDWIINGNGRMVYGGTTYTAELSKLKRYIPLIQELSRKGKVVVLSKTNVDKSEARVRDLIKSKDFDDPHLIAIVEESGCRIICTLDSRSDQYIKDKNLYLKSKKPSIYRRKSHAHLLNKNNIVGKC